jgi:hypothetical protein
VFCGWLFSVFVCLPQTELFRLFLCCFVIQCSVYFIKNMNMYHAAHWSSPSSSHDSRYRTTHQQRTKQRGNGQQQQQQQQRDLDYITTWEEIERWLVDSGRVPEPSGILWNSVRRVTGEWSWHGGLGSPRGSPKNVLGEGHGEYGEVR